jgi:hypothetical protein
MLLKRFREQWLFGRFEGVDFETEILNRIKQSDDNISIFNQWKDQMKFGRLLNKDFKGTLLLKMSGI